MTAGMERELTLRKGTSEIISEWVLLYAGKIEADLSQKAILRG